MDPAELQKLVANQLRLVIDPETGVDVVRMRLIQDLTADASGKITLTFRPSSPLCPVAVPLALTIIKAVNDVPGVTRLDMKVVDYVQAQELNDLLEKILSKQHPGENNG